MGFRSRMPPAKPIIKQGGIFWLKDCEPLDDDNTKDRPVVVVEDPTSLKSGVLKAVVAAYLKMHNR